MTRLMATGSSWSGMSLVIEVESHRVSFSFRPDSMASMACDFRTP
jgi:hypothetical protein